MIGDYGDTNQRGRTHGDLDDRNLQYIESMAQLAEQAGFRLQFFVLGETLEQPCEWLLDLISRGHAVDQHTYSHRSLLDEDQGAVREELARTAELFAARLGERPHGVRGPGGYALGLHDHDGAQQAILDQGMGFVSCLYATKSPTGKYDLFADKNAYMIMKHHQPRRYDSGLLEVPLSGYSDRHFFDGLGRPVAQWIEHLRSCLDFAYDMGELIYAPALHPDVHARHDPGCEAIAALIDHAARKHDPVRFCTYRDIARAFAGAESPEG
jgi:peptidoglycan/xylan/chitin deacetylase (PgdA/CDA1 family)